MKQKMKDPHEAEDRARLMIAVVISLLVLFGFHYFYDKPRQEAMQRQQTALQQAAETKKADVAKAEGTLRPRSEIVGDGARIAIKGKHIRGSLSLKGARIDDLLLNDHYTKVGSADNVALLSPAGTAEAYYVESGWLASQAGIVLPSADSVWRVAPGSARELASGGAPVVLQWDNGHGLTFEKSITLDDNYLFTITQKVTNRTSAEIALNPYHLAARHSLPHDYQGFFVLHEGPIVALNGKSEEPQYKDLTDGDAIDIKDASGWLGITDKYWLVALLPKPDVKFNARVVANKSADKTVYQADAVAQSVKIAAGSSAEEKSYVYAGVKNMEVIKSYESVYGFNNLELGIDFGMWYFITKPFYYLLHWLIHAFGNVGAAILIMTVIVRLAVFPLASKSFRSMAKMKTVAPQMKELQDKYKDDKTKLQMEIYELYKREDVNPFSGCWPMLIQIPIFFALYKVILISVELRHAPFWGWVSDLSAPDPTSVFNLFGLLPYSLPPALMIGAWPVLFCISMILQKRISPPMADATQEKIQNWFPYIVTVMMAHFAVGLVIYWTWSNILGTLQQFYILKKVGGEETSLIRGHAGRRKSKKKADK